MSANTLSLEVQPELPKTFVRGQTLDFVMDLPCDVPANYFNSTVGTVQTVTTVSSELRQVQNAGLNGKIATLTVSWEDLIEYSKLRFYADPTGSWPLGPAEFDVVFVRTVTDTSTGQVKTKTYRSSPIKITIADGVTG